jgi:ubiquinone/menaquinone biosynthesis C-methylase UbiE
LNFKSIFDISENKNSLGNHFREKRFAFFLNKMNKPLTVLDVGGKINFWENRGLAGNKNYEITIVNIEKEKSKYSNIKTSIGNAVDLSQFNNNTFDVVHSNSVIEHLYNFENQKKMASEIIRVGQKHIVQTPNKNFFIEPHYLLPFFQYIPDKLKYLILTKTKLSRLKKWDENFAKQYIKEIRLLSLKEMKVLFPNSKIYFEKFIWMNKSFTMHNF